MNVYKRIEKMLYLYPVKKRQIEVDKITIEELKLKKSEIQATDYERVKIDNSKVGKPTEEEAVNNINLYNILDNRIKENILFCEKIETIYSMLTDLEKGIVEDKYFLKKKDYEIYKERNISKSSFYRFKDYIINKIAFFLH